MASATERRRNNHDERHHPINHISNFIQSTAKNFSSVFIPKPNTHSPPPPSKVLIPLPLLLAADSPTPPASSLFDSSQSDSLPPRPSTSSSSFRRMEGESSSRFPSSLRISGLNSNGKGGGPAFVGQVFTMCDLSGTGLMAVSTHLDLSFISDRCPDWLKKLFQGVNRSERNEPVFRFFMDLGDAVSYVKRLNIPSGVVGACRLDLAYEHFKEKPHLFQFVPNEKQVKEANKLLKKMPQRTLKKKVDGVPVFSAQNLDIAIATKDGIKRYTPYFFDKNMLDNILEESVDQHFHTLIRTRQLQRRREIIDDNLSSDAFEDNGDNVWEPPEVQEVMDEMGSPEIPLSVISSVISKAAEIQLLYTVDKVLLGNRWLRRATGIQPKFPYMVDTFEKRSAASVLRASKSSGLVANTEVGNDAIQLQQCNPSEVEGKAICQDEKKQGERLNFHFPFGDWLSNPWSKQPLNHHKPSDSREASTTTSNECVKEELQQSPFLPKITMVGIAAGESRKMSNVSLRKKMANLTKELEETGQATTAAGGNNSEDKCDERDPLFVANVGDYYSGLSKPESARQARPRSD